MAARFLPAVGGPGVEPGVAAPADLLVAVVLLSQDTQRRLDDSSSQPEHQVKGGLLLDVVIGESPAVLQLFPSKDQSRQFNVIINRSEEKVKLHHLC